MTDISVQFLAFDGCPLAVTARQALEQALAQCEIEDYEEELAEMNPNTKLDFWKAPVQSVDFTEIQPSTSTVQGVETGLRQNQNSISSQSEVECNFKSAVRVNCVLKLCKN